MDRIFSTYTKLRCGIITLMLMLTSLSPLSAQQSLSAGTDGVGITTSDTITADSIAVIPEDTLFQSDGQSTRRLTEVVEEPVVLTIGGSIYGGGNKGDLGGTTNVVINSGTIGGNAFGGARMANVHTSGSVLSANHYASNITFNGGNIAADMAVYGGNDITGNVYGGTKVDIRASLRGSVYGGGNGSYKYTDIAANSSSDFYYDPGSNSIDSLNAHRPNVEATYVHITGKKNASDEWVTTYIGGSVYCGGNSATLRPFEGDDETMLKAHLQLGSYAVVDKVFLGANGEKMVDADVLAFYSNHTTNSSLDLTSTATDANGLTTFDKYMEGVTVAIMPEVGFDGDYSPLSMKIGSFFLGGNKGSMSAPGTFKIPLHRNILIYDKVVGGCNDANITASTYNARHEGGLINNTNLDSEGNKVHLEIEGMRFEPSILSYDEETGYSLDLHLASDNIKMLGGNVYGGCYISGYVNGNTRIDVKEEEVSATAKTHLTNNTNEAYYAMMNDVFSTALSAFGGGYGTDSKIIGNTRVNIRSGATEGMNHAAIKVFGGGEMGSVTGNTEVNIINGQVARVYGGGYQGNIGGHTTVNLDGGTMFDVIGGSCDADIEGYSEVYIGANGIPTVHRNVYAGNDLGGSIKGFNDFTSRVSDFAKPKVYGYDAGTGTSHVLTASAYVEYLQGSVQSIFGGCYGNYDYATTYSAQNARKPHLANAFVNFRPKSENKANHVDRIYGAGYGFMGGADKDKMQDRSYVLIDDEQEQELFTSTQVFGAGNFCGLGMRLTAAAALEKLDSMTAVVDLIDGHISAAYGGSYDQGVTRRTKVNVPVGSMAKLTNIFGGAFGVTNEYPCDVYESQVNYHSASARANYIYGGNNAYRRTLYAQVNVSAKLTTADNESYSGYVYGAGRGANSWARYTEVNLEKGAEVYEAYGGGYGGMVLNKDSEIAYASRGTVDTSDDYNLNLDEGSYDALEALETSADGLQRSSLAKENLLHSELGKGLEKYNTNVLIKQGAYVSNYCYGGSYGNKDNVDAGLVAGTTYISLLGGRVQKDIYAAGTLGAVQDKFGTESFTASANAYIKGGSARNVYGAGWKGNVGYHETGASTANDVLGETNVYIGKPDNKAVSFVDGYPTIQRNAYGGGEGETKDGVTQGSSVYGVANLTLFNGYIGYTYEHSEDSTAAHDVTFYQEKLDDETAAPDKQKNALVKAGNLFGGGYVDASNTDVTNVTMYGGVVRNSVYGGGEIGCIGRGRKNLETGAITIDKGGQTHIYIYKGEVKQDVFGGGRGFANVEWIVSILGTAGYIFGGTDVNIYGGTIGTDTGLAEGVGNVFGGGNIGYVYTKEGTKVVDTNSKLYGYYVKDGIMTEDCRVIVSPHAQVLAGKTVTINGRTYNAYEYVPTEDLNKLTNSSTLWNDLDRSGVTIKNAVFAGGNVSDGSDRIYANTKTVYGNATATVKDLFFKDLISIGGDGIGGLYGDGNLTFVDGYRELNITNYGTDYYRLNNELTYDEYLNLNDRERTYFELKYVAKRDHSYHYYASQSWHTYGGTTYKRNQKITQDTYDDMDASEQARWKAGTAFYNAGDKISAELYELMDAAEQSSANWEIFGFCTLYVGRMMNTIQRADFCGVFGSRIVLRGAQDRVPSTVDYTNYTINRVDELSLNQVTQSGDTHGNYFGIYNVVNYLGALTSDVKFTDERQTNSGEPIYATDGSSYYTWKQTNLNNRKRNNGTSANEVALNSGVWLEIVNKETEKTKVKTYGPITGVVQLALISVKTGEGGGYVYAKNEHRLVKSIAEPAASHTTLSLANQNAVSYKQFTFYDEDEAGHEAIRMQTSGNFVNSVKRIIDDCYPNSGKYLGATKSPAHYWYIRGEYYVYDQYISAYTGAANAYPESVSIPLTITPEARGRLQLDEVQDNYYAYWTEDQADLATFRSRHDASAVLINEVTYHKNDPITYWEWSRLTPKQQAFFTKDTYVCSIDMTVPINGTNVTFTADSVLTAAEYNRIPADRYVCITDYTETTGEGNLIEHQSGEAKTLTTAEYEALDPVIQQYYATARSLVNSSNAVSHDNGFLLTFDWDNPDVWNDYYQYITDVGSTGYNQIIRKSKYGTLDPSDQEKYIEGPSFYCNRSGVYGQLSYTVGDIIDKDNYGYQAQVISNLSSIGMDEAALNTQANQASFERTYIAKNECHFTIAGEMYDYVAGAPISAALYNTFRDVGTTYSNNFEEAYICTETFQISDEEFFLYGDLITASDYDAIDTRYSEVATELKKVLSEAYICTNDGAWGGNIYAEGTNYPAINYCNLSKEERSNFNYNYDALDLLSEDFVPTTEDGNMNMYQGETHGIDYTGQIPYSEKEAIDYTATYLGGESGTETLPLINPAEVTHKNGTKETVSELVEGDVLTNLVYEELVNEQYHYTPIIVSGADEPDTTFYIVNTGFQVGDNWYNVGASIKEEIYLSSSPENQAKVTLVPRASLPDLPIDNEIKNYYFCTSEYEAVTEINDITGNTISVGSPVPVGTIINASGAGCYDELKNEQKGFSIIGTIPTETSTLFVARDVDINDLRQDKIVTAVYWYEYLESDESGTSYETIRERHIVNVHIHFESGVPVIGELLPPDMVIPGTAVGLNQPTVTKGAYEVLGGGWEVFRNIADATSHKNGIPYVNNSTKTYWYQDGYYVAYYAKSYLGKTYSNAVQFSVANYHDLDAVMADTLHHMYVDYPQMWRNSKIYIDDRDCVSDPEKSKLDLLNDMFRLSTLSETDIAALSNTDPLHNHTALNERVRGLGDLEFFLKSNVTSKKNMTVVDGQPIVNWTPIGQAEDQCFMGNLHGNGNSIQVLDHSLFHSLCGNVYNLGVDGHFTQGGVADHGSGRVENVWVRTAADPSLLTNNLPVIADVDGATIVNTYHPTHNTFKQHTAPNIEVIPRPAEDFANGIIAYDLNRFYLEARYGILATDANKAADGRTITNHALFRMPDGTIVQNELEINTPQDYPVKYSTGEAIYGTENPKAYVENLIGDGDFRFCDGVIPKVPDVRYYRGTYYPVFPDDYIFFGQRLSYGLYDNRTHNIHPEAAVKIHSTSDSQGNVNSTDHMLLTNNAAQENRIYRAPAYFRDGIYGKSVVFNADAAFSGHFQFNDTLYTPHKDLTAIDFSGGNGDTHGTIGVIPGTQSDFTNRSGGYHPLLDFYVPLNRFITSSVTQNLLAYSQASTSTATDISTRTNSVLNSYFGEPELTEGQYRTVDRLSNATVAYVKGHLVQKNNDGYFAASNQFLVDRNDFNAPISYKFNPGYRMWYQRTPDNFAERTKGWEGVCLPFTAELVTTQQKGEITHFYASSDKGHEYWLREYTGIDSEKSSDEIAVAKFNLPSAGTITKTDGNTFLFDYYYSEDEFKDLNTDLYPDSYYQAERSYPNYAFLQKAKPYIIGLPGVLYYEFDLSGQFIPTTNYGHISKLDKQAITFVSDMSTEENPLIIAKSDDEIATNKVTADGYTFVPSYMNYEFKAEAGKADNYLLNSSAATDAGSSFDVVTATPATVEAFRPYFTQTTLGGAPQGVKPQHIMFSMSLTQPSSELNQDSDDADTAGLLHVYTKNNYIIVESSLTNETEVQIVNVAGVTVRSFSIKAGGMVQTRVVPGVYIIGTSAPISNRINKLVVK